ncbi:Predicted esterase [Escherichia coli]|uniref:Predicted esterase n=1 Tax=Escherichia coli TaxID=562 RepID=A0A377D0T5_ECOLX|nr:Predicted esterase [Escherichia coli]
MIIYLHGFDSNSPGNHEKVLQLQFIDPDVRLISYSTRHPKHDMQHLLKEVDKMLQLNVDERPLICGVGLGRILGGTDWFSLRHPPGDLQP